MRMSTFRRLFIGILRVKGSVDDTLTLIISGRIQFIFTEINHEYLSRDAVLYAH